MHLILICVQVGLKWWEAAGPYKVVGSFGCINPLIVLVEWLAQGSVCVTMRGL